MAILDALEVPGEPLTHPQAAQLVHIDVDLLDFGGTTLPLIFFELAAVVEHLELGLHAEEAAVGRVGNHLGVPLHGTRVGIRLVVQLLGDCSALPSIWLLAHVAALAGTLQLALIIRRVPISS